MGLLPRSRARFSFSLQAYAASLLVAMGAVSPLPLWAQSSTSGDRSPFCQVVEDQTSPYLDVTAIRDAIEQGGDLNQLCDFYGQQWLPLNLLISSESDLIERAIAQGADVNGQDGEGNTPLHYIRYHGEAVAQLLIDRGANVNARNHQGSTPLHNIYGDKSPEVMQLLLDHGADINASNQEYFTPLHRATEETIAWLLANGADLNARTNQNWTPLHYAVTVPAVAIPLIEAGADLTLQNAYGAPIHGNSLAPAVLTAMLDQGVNVNLTNQQGETPLHRHRFSPELTRILIDHGADVNAQDNQGWTPLFDVNIDVARQLVAAGADLTVQDHQGRTALHQAAIEATSYWGTELTALFLSQDLPEPLYAVRDNNGETALEIAQRLGKTEIANLLQVAEAAAGNDRADGPADENTAVLRQLLRAQNWAAADRETRRLLDPASVPNQATEAPVVTPALIRAIDQAWLTASDGRFGLSVQLRLWQAAQAAHPNDRDAAVNDFRDRVGWKIPDPREEPDFISSDWRNESELTYSLQAPEGHLPWAGVSDAVVQDLATPGPGEHCGSCTIDAMALRDSRFYGRIPELMAAVATAMNPPADASWRSPQERFRLDLTAIFQTEPYWADSISPHAVAISPDSQLIAVSSSTNVADYEATLALWNLTTGTHRVTLLPVARLRAEALAFSADSQTLWARLNNGDLAIWDTARGTLMKQWSADQWGVSEIVTSRDGNYVYTGGNGTVKIWSPSGQLYRTLRLSAGEVNPGPVRSLLLSPDGRQLAVATDRTIQLWGTEGRLIKVTTQITDQTEIVYDAFSLANGMAFSPDSRYFATLDTDRSVKLWNAATGARVITLRMPDPPQALAFTQDGQTLIVRDHQQMLMYWNLQTYQRDRTLSVDTTDTEGAIFLARPIILSPDGQTFAVPLLMASLDGAIDLRRTSDGERLAVLPGNTLQFSPDNRWLVTETYTARIWSPE
ncbi:ankyrin repeat domain-containing protein [Nodosilinea sp. LEGE 07088]|uniref:ankyrin repeat domain-containing protein n=1 Tax=Nodosilinea sp. LEGE 07088 TaxID=2777968 RepID=UPI0018818687|nr:ankyrin repeat domain-containing protein [Nodosilinea sp. LEGE 07088]MBE9136764.1 ankyrin repeat domain-containing protein [Nodosilinea sp. LEGE 07088]